MELWRERALSRRCGGGVGFLYKDNLSVLINPSDHFTSFESMSAVISNGTTSLEILVIYRPPGYQSFSLFILILTTAQILKPFYKTNNAH